MPGTVSVLPAMFYLQLLTAVGSRDYYTHVIDEETEA